MKPKVILIAGPTGSGKSSLALAIAERVGGVVINADSMQVYRDLAVLTARPDAADLARVPHRLYGFVDAADPYSTGRYARDAEAVLEDVRRDGRTAIIVGGTGLYFAALLEGLAPVPEIPAEVRRHWRAEVARIGPPAAHALLASRDPAAAARLEPTDPQRIARALEVHDATGRSLIYWQGQPGRPVPGLADATRLVVMPPRDEIYRRCDRRLAAMLDAGALYEVARLAKRGLAADLPLMRAVGLRPLLAHLSGERSRAEAVAAAQLETRHYVKRQMTWLRRNMIAWKMIDSTENFVFDDVKFP